MRAFGPPPRQAANAGRDAVLADFVRAYAPACWRPLPGGDAMDDDYSDAMEDDLIDEDVKLRWAPGDGEEAGAVVALQGATNVTNAEERLLARRA